jgi:DNA-binding NarL/FixJ family response regulator
MLVDDHMMVRRGLATFLKVYDDLQLAGEAESGEDAIRVCSEVLPDVVLMDLVLPKMDGAAATRAIRKSFPQVRVLALTSFNEGELIKNALEAGAIGYLLKDVTADELARAIRAAHSGRATLSPEAAQALVETANKQYADRREADRESLHGQIPRQQHTLEIGRCKPHGGRDACPAPADRALALQVSPKWPRYKLSHGRMRRNSVRRILSSARQSGLNQPGVGTSKPEIVP